MVLFKTDNLRMRNKSDDAKATGHTVALLPQGGTAPGDLITLAANAGINWQYDFPAGLTSGLYDVYINSLPMQHSNEQVQVWVMRPQAISTSDIKDAAVTPPKTDFALDYTQPAQVPGGGS